MALVLPPNEVFDQVRTPLADNQGGRGTFAWLRDECPKSGGLFAYYQDEPYPRKGHVYPEAVEANNIVKKLTIGGITALAMPAMALPVLGFLLLPWKQKIKILEKVLSNYCRVVDYTNRSHYLKRRFYNKFGKELWDLTYHFLRQLGISVDIAYRCGRIIAHLFEHEDAYRARVQDIFTEASFSQLIFQPRKEILRLAEIYLSREKEGLQEKFLSIVKIASLLLWLPRVKKIFRETIRQAKPDSLKYDEIDRYYVLNRIGYDYLGRTIEDRFEEYRKRHNQHVINNLRKEIPDPVVLENVIKQLTTLGYS